MIMEAIRRQIKKSRLSRYQISKDTGVDAATLFRIMHRKSCTVETAEALFKYFKLKVHS
jgi:hypothetical protein